MADRIGKPISQRQLRVGEMIKQSLCMIFIRNEAKLPNLETNTITVTEVKMSPDLGIAKIYLSVFNREDKPNVILELESQYTRLRQSFGQRVRKHMRRVPNLSFFLDETLDEMYRLNQSFDKLNAGKPVVNKEEEE